MDKAAFRKKLIEKIDRRLNQDDIDDVMSFSEFWEPVRDDIDESADDEDIADADSDDDDGEVGDLEDVNEIDDEG